ncbi:hypothetical protein KIPB_012866, partial [Kipferlia bialata]
AELDDKKGLEDIVADVWEYAEEVAGVNSVTSVTIPRSTRSDLIPDVHPTSDSRMMFFNVDCDSVLVPGEGFIYVSFQTPAQAHAALQSFAGITFMGRRIVGTYVDEIPKEIIPPVVPEPEAQPEAVEAPAEVAAEEEEIDLSFLK